MAGPGRWGGEILHFCIICVGYKEEYDERILV
jgi:hypothetical protein